MNPFILHTILLKNAIDVVKEYVSFVFNFMLNIYLFNDFEAEKESRDITKETIN